MSQELIEANVVISPEATQVIADTTFTTIAESFGVIDSPQLADEANKFLRETKEGAEKAQKMLDLILAPFERAVKEVRGKFKPAIDDRAAAEKIIKTKLLAWSDLCAQQYREQERLAAEARRKVEAEAAAKAAAERARTEEQARALQAQADEEARKREEALAAGNTRAAAAASARAAALTERSSSVAQAGEMKAQELVLSAAAIPVAASVAVKAPAGTSMRKNWQAELPDGSTEDAAKRALCAAIASGRTELFAFLDLNWSALHKSAKSYEHNFTVPGFIARNNPILASRSVK